MAAKRIGYMDDLSEMPEEGPFVVCDAPVGYTDWIEQATGPDGVGCPVTLDHSVYAYMKAHDIPCGYEGACRLNEAFARGELAYDVQTIIPTHTVVVKP